MNVVRINGVDREVVAAIANLAARLAKVSPSLRPLTIYIVPSVVVSGGEHGCGFAAFETDGEVDRIWIAGEQPDDLDDQDWMGDMIPSSLAHEWSHLEQARDGRKIQERGVGVRARSLLRMVRDYVGPVVGPEIEHRLVEIDPETGEPT